MKISKTQAFYILATMEFLLELKSDYLEEPDKDLCDLIFERWPKFKRQFTVLAKVC